MLVRRDVRGQHHQRHPRHRHGGHGDSHYEMDPGFRQLRERVKTLEIHQLKKDIAAIREGRDEELLRLRDVYKEERDVRLRQVEELFQNMERDILAQYETELEAINDKHEQTISNAKKQIKAEIDRKRAVIDEEAQNLSLEAELLEEGLGSDRTLRQRTGDRAGTSRKKKKTGASTATDYRLSAQQLSLEDWEINDDVQLLTNEKRARKAGRGNQAPSGSSAGAADGGSKSPAYDYY